MANCTVTFKIEEIDGLCPVDDNDFRNPNQNNYIELKEAIFADSKYHQIGKRLASYDSSTGDGFFILPQGSIVDLQMDIIGITKQSNQQLPAQANITLNALITLWNS